MVKKIILFFLILLISIPCFSKNGKAIINCKNGGGWLFIYSADGSMCQVLNAFKGRIVKLDIGSYAFAFDHGGKIGFNNGFPRPEAEYHIIKIEENKTITINVKMEFR